MIDSDTIGGALLGRLEFRPQLPSQPPLPAGRHALQFERLLVIESARASEGLGDDGMRCETALAAVGVALTHHLTAHLLRT